MKRKFCLSSRREFFGHSAGTLAVLSAIASQRIQGTQKVSPNPFAYDISRLQKTDPKIIAYEETARWKAPHPEARRLAIAHDDTLYLCSGNYVTALNQSGERGPEITRLQLHRSDVGIVLIGNVLIDFNSRRSARIDCIPEQIHSMSAHIAHLSHAEVAVHVPEQAVQTVRTSEILRAVGVVGRWSDPLLVVKERRRHAFGGGIAGSGEPAAVPCMHGLQFADGSVQHQFAQALEIRVRMALGAMLCGQLGFPFQVIRAHRAHLVHCDSERLFAEDMHVAVERPVSNERVVMICGANDDGLDVFLVKPAAPVPICLGFGEESGFLQALLSVGNPERFVEEVAKLVGPKGFIIREWAMSKQDLKRAVSEILERGVRDEWEFLFNIKNPPEKFHNGTGREAVSEDERLAVPPMPRQKKLDSIQNIKVRGTVICKLIDTITDELSSLSLVSSRRMIIIQGGSRSGKTTVLAEIRRRLLNEAGVESYDMSMSQQISSPSKCIFYMDDSDIEMSATPLGEMNMNRFYKSNHLKYRWFA